METYIEATLVMNGILIGLCSLVSSMYFAAPLSMKKTAVLSFALVGYHMVVQDVWYFVVLGEAFFAYQLRCQAKVALVALALRMMMNLTCSMLFMGAIEGMIWYVPKGQGRLVWISLAIYVIVLLYLPKISSHWLKKNYMYPVSLNIHDYQLKGNGYLDSGNIASSQGIPVIFINKNSFDELELPYDSAIKVRIRTLHGVGYIDCYHAKITIIGHQEKEVLVGYMEEIKVKKNCDVLLNVKLFQAR